MRNNGIFVNSRGFTLQNVGELAWIKRYLDFEAIDELVLVNIDRETKDIERFAGHMRELAKLCFVPISAGGGVRKIADFERLLASGADKIIVNSEFYERPEFITQAARRFGGQCVVASVDARRQADGSYRAFADNGTRDTGRDVISWLREAEDRGAGEIFLTSIDRDGCGEGYDIDLLKAATAAISIPVIASGGVGEFDHLVEGIIDGGASAVSAANIFHYIGNGLIKAKMHIRGQGLDFPVWKFSESG